ncbi:MAG: hypothetical protein R2745_08575 [Vicinamibacterales bacterium]
MTGFTRTTAPLAFVAALGWGAAACGGGSTTGPTTNPPATGVTLASLAPAPATTAGCGPVQITATLSGAAPAAGATVTLTSGSAAVAVQNITIAGGATTGSAPVTPQTATASTPVTITGTLAAGTGTAASSQSTTVTLGPPFANFSVNGTARGADACQLQNSGGQVDCTFNGATSVGAARWSWAWDVGPNSGAADTTTPTLQPTTGCGLFTNAPVQGTTGNTFVQMIVRLTVQDAGGTRSCVTRNANVRVFSGGFCGGF